MQRRILLDGQTAVISSAIQSQWEQDELRLVKCVVCTGSNKRSLTLCFCWRLQAFACLSSCLVLDPFICFPQLQAMGMVPMVWTQVWLSRWIILQIPMFVVVLISQWLGLSMNLTTRPVIFLNSVFLCTNPKSWVRSCGRREIRRLIKMLTYFSGMLS